MFNIPNRVVTHMQVFADSYHGANPAYVYAKQYDANSRYLVISVMSSSGKITASGLPQLNAKKPDGTFSFIEGIIVDGDVVIKLTSQLLSAPGKVTCDVTIFGSDEEGTTITTTATFFIIVLESQYHDDAIESMDEFSGVQEVLAQMAKDRQAVEDAVKRVDNVVNDAVAELTDELEKVVDEYLDDIVVAVDSIDANHVFFPKDTSIVITSAIGELKAPDNEVLEIDLSGKSLMEFITMTSTRDREPAVTKPSVRVEATSGAYEVGSIVDVSYNVIFSTGSYQYDSSTGIMIEKLTVTNSAGGVSDDASGVFNDVLVTDDLSYCVTADIVHSAGNTPHTLLGKEYAVGAISAGRISSSGSKLSGYRNTFYGTMNDKSAISSDALRSLSKSGRSLSRGSTFTIPCPVGAMKVLFAYPQYLGQVTSVKDVNGLNAEIKSSFTEALVDVDGANGYNPITYRLLYLEFAEPNDKANNYLVTI